MSCISHPCCDDPGRAPPVKEPFITVVTVSFNNLVGLEKTVESVARQKYPGIEHIIIDGGSTDGSAELIRQFEERLDFWSSEPDRGIYDAMNKGIKKSRGEWIIFMNAGDVFYSDAAVQKAAGKIDQSADLIYGSWVYRQLKFGDLSLNKQPLGLDSLWRGMPFSHQALFARSSLLRQRPFSLDYKYCADYDFVYRMYSEKRKFQKIDEIIAVVASGGESDIGRAERRREQYIISARYDGKASHRGFLLFVRAVILVWDCIKVYIPEKMLRELYALRHRRSTVKEKCALQEPAGLTEEGIE